MKYKKDVKAVYGNSFCMDSDCIHYFEDTCMLCLNDIGCSIFPDSTVYLKGRDSEECKSFAGGANLIYVLTNEQLIECSEQYRC